MPETTPILSRLRERGPAAGVGLGLAAVGRPGYINLGRAEDLPDERPVDVMRERAHRLLDAAYEQGVRYFDAARSYGRAEEFLAGWLERNPGRAEDVVVGSKWGYTYTADWRVGADVNEVKDHHAATYTRQLAKTRALLDGHLTSYQIHSLTLESPALTDPELHALLGRLRADGVTVGFSTSGPRQAETVRAAMEIEVDGAPLFGSVQATCNLLEPSVAPALAEAHDAGLAVIVKEAMANGRLAGAHAPQPLRRAAEEQGAAPDALAIAAWLHRPWTDVVLSGAVTTGQLTANLRATELSWDPTSLDGLAEPAADYWRTRAALPWT
ncbi:aldo/keto reductase [Streptomyces sp. NPDC050560]|uniref:aldo/keto reductase n=1 Tax=Streptomyces sp. NPDC050560 TaxID=3365630 RepID=UPI0037985505